MRCSCTHHNCKLSSALFYELSENSFCEVLGGISSRLRALWAPKSQLTVLTLAESAERAPAHRAGTPHTQRDAVGWWGPSLKQPRLVLAPVVSRQRTPPQLLLEENGMRVWHLPCVYRGSPLVEIRIRVASPAFMAFPTHVTHAFFALWRDACAAVEAAAVAAGLSLSFSNVCDEEMADLCAVEGVTLIAAGFSGSTQRFVADVFQCLAQMCNRLAALEQHRMPLPQAALDDTGAQAATEEVKGGGSGTAVPVAVPSSGMVIHDTHAAIDAPDIHQHDIVEGALMEEVALRRLDNAALAQLDEVCPPHSASCKAPATCPVRSRCVLLVLEFTAPMNAVLIKLERTADR